MCVSVYLVGVLDRRLAGGLVRVVLVWWEVTADRRSEGGVENDDYITDAYIRNAIDGESRRIQTVSAPYSVSTPYHTMIITLLRSCA